MLNHKATLSLPLFESYCYDTVSEFMNANIEIE